MSAEEIKKKDQTPTVSGFLDEHNARRVVTQQYQDLVLDMQKAKDILTRILDGHDMNRSLVYQAWEILERSLQRQG